MYQSGKYQRKFTEIGQRKQHQASEKYVGKHHISQNLKSGIRGEQFYSFIKNILVSRGKMTTAEANLLLSDRTNVELFNDCFVHESFDSQRNYELLEYFGDKIVDYSISKYLGQRFPKLVSSKNPQSLKIITKVHLFVRSTDFLSQVGEDLGFKPYISASESYLTDKTIKKIYEDVFEAFIGACDKAINRMTKEEVGYIICYEILKSIFDTYLISLKYEDVVDPITRLKELASRHELNPVYINKQASGHSETFIQFTVNNGGNYERRQTPVLETISKDEGKNETYKLFYEYMRTNPKLVISDVELVQKTVGKEPSGESNDYSIQVSMFIPQYGTVKFANGYGYDEKSAKKNAATNALNHLLRLGYQEKDVWNESDYI